MQKNLLPVCAALGLALAAGPSLAAQSPAPAGAPAPSTPAASAPAPAQPAAPAAPQNGFGGPVIPGVCLLSREAVFAQSAVGQAATAGLKQLGQKAQAALDSERHALEVKAKALQSQQMTLTPPQVQQRQQQLQARAQALQTEAAQASREIEAARAKAMGRIEEAVQPVVVAAYQAKGCGLLISRDAILGGNMSNDLTAAVVQGLGAKMTTITIEREHLPAAER